MLTDVFGGNVYPSSCLNLGLMEYCFYSFAKVVRIYQLSKKARLILAD